LKDENEKKNKKRIKKHEAIKLTHGLGHDTVISPSKINEKNIMKHNS
jgi:hypothetical protein